MPTPAENLRLGQARAAVAGYPPGPPAGQHLVRIIEYTVTVEDVQLAAPPAPSRSAWPPPCSTTSRHQPRSLAAALPPALGERERLRRAQDPAPRGRLHPALQVTRSWPARNSSAFLTVYQALCALETDAARPAGIDPDRISFTVTVRVARDHAASHAIITPHSLALARRQAIADLLSDICPLGAWSMNASGN